LLPNVFLFCRWNKYYSAITYCLSHRSENNAYLRQVEAEFDEFQHEVYDVAFSEKMTKARRELQLL